MEQREFLTLGVIDIIDTLLSTLQSEIGKYNYLRWIPESNETTNEIEHRFYFKTHT